MQLFNPTNAIAIQIIQIAQPFYLSFNYLCLETLSVSAEVLPKISKNDPLTVKHYSPTSISTSSSSPTYPTSFPSPTCGTTNSPSGNPLSNLSCCTFAFDISYTYCPKCSTFSICVSPGTSSPSSSFKTRLLGNSSPVTSCSLSGLCNKTSKAWRSSKHDSKTSRRPRM